MPEKKRMLIIGIMMNCAGTEKSFLSFINTLDRERYDIELMLARKAGPFLSHIPPDVKVTELPGGCGELFLMSGRNAASTLWRCFCKRNPFTLFEIFPWFVRILLTKGEKRSAAATRLWIRMMNKLPTVEGEYDIALAYWGDRTMFYMVDKVSAAKKLAWLHFEYGNPPRDDGIYEPYFSRCDKVITVSPTVERALCEKLPSISERVLTIENINDKQLIWNMALQGKSFPDRVYTGTRLLSVIRICEQKGVDFIVPVLKQLRADGYELRWYILGGGDKSAVDALKVQAVNEGVADMLMLLGTTDNPYPYMRDCDIYVQPSRYEGKPITVEEAKILCRPIVACRYASADEQLERGRFGVVVDIGAEGLYGGIRRLLDDRSERERLSRELASCDFGNESEIDKFYDAVE